MIARLVSAGYLQPEQRNDPEAIANAIARMKIDLRGGKGSDDPPAAWELSLPMARNEKPRPTWKR
jgi:hypothetical protein